MRGLLYPPRTPLSPVTRKGSSGWAAEEVALAVSARPTARRGVEVRRVSVKTLSRASPWEAARAGVMPGGRQAAGKLGEARVKAAAGCASLGSATLASAMVSASWER